MDINGDIYPIILKFGIRLFLIMISLKDITIDLKIKLKITATSG